MSTVARTSDAEVSVQDSHDKTGHQTSGPVRTLRRIAATILVVILLQVFAGSTYSNHETYVSSYNVWNVFHYYLGAKYFPEVGYFNLYTCALEAEHESAGYWDGIVGVRDMATYRFVPRFSLPPCPRENFTTARWSEFSRDVEYFAAIARPNYFANLYTDKGFNPPPSWVVIAKPLAQAVPISRSWVTDIVFNLDIAAVLIGMLIIWRCRGGVVALLTSGLTVFYFGNFGCIGGNFLQYLWFPLVVLAAIFWTNNRPGSSGAVLGMAVGFQMFPVFFGLPIVMRGIIEFLRGRRKLELRPYLRFSSALMAVILLNFFLGSWAGTGNVWSEWQKKISIHKHYLQGEVFDIGLANLTAIMISTNHNDGKSYVNEVQNTFMRIDSLKREIWIYYVLSVVFLAMWALIVIGAPGRDLFGHGFLIMYAAVSVSPYYYLTLALVPLMFWNSCRMMRRYATCGTIALFALHAILFRGSSVSGLYLPHLVSECSIALFLLGLAVLPVLALESLNSTQIQEPEIHRGVVPALSKG